MWKAGMGIPTDRHTDMTALFRRGLAGEEGCYAEFLAMAASWLRGVVVRRVPASDVEDVVQEILISIHKARHTHDGERPLAPWMRAIAGFRVTDHLRKHYAAMSHLTFDIEEMNDTLPDVTEDPSGHEYVNELLEGVPEREQKILTLMHVEGFTAKEVGVQMGMKESAVKVAAHRAVKKLRQAAGI